MGLKEYRLKYSLFLHSFLKDITCFTKYCFKWGSPRVLPINSVDEISIYFFKRGWAGDWFKDNLALTTQNSSEKKGECNLNLVDMIWYLLFYKEKGIFFIL